MQKRIMTPEHFRTKPINWWPHEQRFPADSFVFSKLKNSSHLKIVEIGPGRGRLTFPVRDMGHEVHAIEINPKFIEYCTKKDTRDIYFYNNDAGYLPFKDETFDFALCIEVLMHLPEPLKALQELNRVLKTDGKLILMFLRKYTYGYYVTTFKYVTHLYEHILDYKFHSWYEIKKLLRKSNFEVIEVYNKKSGIPYIYSQKK